MYEYRSIVMWCMYSLINTSTYLVCGPSRRLAVVRSAYSYGKAPVTHIHDTYINVSIILYSNLTHLCRSQLRGGRRQLIHDLGQGGQTPVDMLGLL